MEENSMMNGGENTILPEEMRQLLGSWTVELANWLTDQGLSRSEAFRKAHLTRQLLEKLGEGEVVFRYVKGNGEERQARGTLCRGLCEDFDRYEYKREDGVAFGHALQRGVYVYFDLERKAFRSFAAKNLLTIDSTEELRIDN